MTLVTNVDANSKQVAARRWGPGGVPLGTDELDAAWPTGVYSLSHLAIPFSPDDPVYGLQTGEYPVIGIDGDLAISKRCESHERKIDRLFKALEFVNAGQEHI